MASPSGASHWRSDSINLSRSGENFSSDAVTMIDFIWQSGPLGRGDMNDGEGGRFPAPGLAFAPAVPRDEETFSLFIEGIAERAVERVAVLLPELRVEK